MMSFRRYRSKNSAPKDAAKNFSVLNPIEKEPDADSISAEAAHLKTKIGTGAVICMPPDMIPVDQKNGYVPVWLI